MMNPANVAPNPPPSLILPGVEDRTIVIGSTGDGKTILVGWLLSQQRLDKRPWVWIDYKDEILLDEIGSPPIRRLRLGEMPGKRGLYRMFVRPDQSDEMENWLWKVWVKGNIGIVCDECALLPRSDAVKSIMRQGRSKWIPFIGATQRPVGCDPEIFSEAQYRVLFSIGDEHRDLPIIKGLFGRLDVRTPLPGPFWSYWYDVRRKQLTTLRPVPAPAIVAANIRAAAPRHFSFGG